jgi:hypothetical protein
MGVYSQPRSSARRMQRRGELRHGAVAARFGQYLTLARGERVLSLAQGKAGKAATTTAIWSREGSEAAKSTTGTPTQRIPKIEAAHCHAVLRQAVVAGDGRQPRARRPAAGVLISA